MKLRKPATLLVETSDGSKQARIDVFNMWRKLIDCDKKPTPDQKWEAVSALLADALGVDKSQVVESQAVMFWEAIIKIGKQEEAELKKAVGETLCLQPPTPDSPPVDQPDAGSSGQTS